MEDGEQNARTEEVRAQLAAAAGASRGRGRGYGAEARAIAVSHAQGLIASGWPMGRVAVTLGLSPVTLKAWLLAAADTDPSGAFAEVRVQRETPSMVTALRLVLPSGARVEGLDVMSAAALVRALS